MELENNSPSTSTWVKSLLGALTGLFILSFIYTYLIDLNPLIYLNFFAWILFSVFIAFPTFIVPAKGIIPKLVIALLAGIFAIYLVYGIRSSIFMHTAMVSLEKEVSMWPPRVNFKDLFFTLVSPVEYRSKLEFLFEYHTMSIGKVGRKASEPGKFPHLLRVVECAGMVALPIYAAVANKDED